MEGNGGRGKELTKTDRTKETDTYSYIHEYIKWINLLNSQYITHILEKIKVEIVCFHGKH